MKKLSSTDVNITLMAHKKIYAHSVKNSFGKFLLIDVTFVQVLNK